MRTGKRLLAPPVGMGALALGYFLAYIPFAALTRALSTGELPGVDERVGGLVLLPAASLGVLAGTFLFLAVSGWWRHLGLRELGGRERRLPGRTMIGAGAAMAVIVATTILNFTFVGVSILFMLLMMRAGTLCMAPLVDIARKRLIRTSAWVGLALSLAAIAVALTGVDAYALTIGAVLSLAAYMLGYAARFRLMSRDAKTGDPAIDRRYFAEEQLSAALILPLACAVLALIGAGSEMQALREGFTGFMSTPGVAPAVLVGLLYSVLYVFGTLIYLDPREYAWSVPINRASSVLSAAVASYALTWQFGLPVPPPQTLIAAEIVLLAIAALSYPALGPLFRRGAERPSRRLVLFVCGANRGRSPIAAALMRDELAGWEPHLADGLYATSAGVGNVRPGAPMSPEAARALAELGVRVHSHGSQPLTRALCDGAVAIYCMTAEQREAVVAIAPDAASRTYRLDPAADLPEPEHGSQEAWAAYADRVRALVSRRLADLPDRSLAPAPGI